MNRTERDAREFAIHAKQGGWRLGLLVARNAERGKGGAGRTGVFQPKNSGKVSASEFARLCEPKTTAKRVLRYLEAWEKAADDGVVPAAETLRPGEEIKLDAEKLPAWTDYYSTTEARPSDGWRSPATRPAAIQRMTDRQAASLISDVARAKPRAVEEAVRSRDDSAQALRHAVHEHDAEERTQRTQRELRHHPGTPLSRVIERIPPAFREWERHITWLDEEIGGDDMTDDQRRSVIQTGKALEARLHAYVSGLEGRRLREDVLEGQETP